MSEIYSKMIELVVENNNVYTKRWFKTKLKSKYGGYIMFTEAPGKPNVVCFKNMTEFIVNDKSFSERKKDSNDEAERIILTAAMLTNKHVTL